MIYKVSAPSQVVSQISAINSISRCLVVFLGEGIFKVQEDDGAGCPPRYHTTTSQVSMCAIGSSLNSHDISI